MTQRKRVRLMTSKSMDRNHVSLSLKIIVRVIFLARNIIFTYDFCVYATKIIY